MKKVLVIRFSSAGDIVCTTLALERLRSHYRKAEISFLTKDIFAGLLESNRSIDRIVPFPSDASLRKTIAFSRALASERFDLVVDLHSSTRSRLVRMLTRPARSLHLQKKLTRRLHLSQPKASSPIPIRYLRVLETLGVDQSEGSLSIPVESIDTPFELDTEAITITIAPGARHYTKRWPAERYAAAAIELLDHLSLDRKGQIVVLGGMDEQETCNRVVTAIESESSLHITHNLCGETTWLETARAIADSSILLANDSVAGHMAAAVGTPVVSLFGSTVPAFGFAPYTSASTVVEELGLPCRPCSRIGRDACPRGDFACMDQISPDRVASAARTLLEDQAS